MALRRCNNASVLSLNLLCDSWDMDEPDLSSPVSICHIRRTSNSGAATGQRTLYSHDRPVCLSVRPSVRPSVRHTLVSYQNDQTRLLNTTASSQMQSPKTLVWQIRFIPKFERIHRERRR